ncbi:unnamed protein product [Larinioides sclopetarius]|uniref:RNA-polymerase II-associated protein 3-like C-terminal domain-containing protein n=1 Tax=Larinioides sclopetarius TaxID=280406 RepID=A0AAV2AXM7_9ARAC
MVISNPQASLLEKLNLTLEQLDYKYIEHCKNVKQLERILRVLRSGEEGVYPHLIEFCKARLEQVDPGNKYLLTAKGIMKYSDIPEEEKDNILSGLEEWSKEYSKRTPQNTSTVFDIPPVRGQKISEMQSQSGSNNGKQRTNEAKNKICKLRSYQEWDKFDIEEELEKLEGKDEIEKTENKTEEKISLNTSIAVPGLSAVEREHIANLERMKGNEAFKAQDYEEAVLYYTRSLSAFRTAKTLNNRAQTHLKLKNYLEAVIDCNEVINMEPNNIKALYRRGIAHKEAKMLDLAVIDFEIILRLEPESKSARDQLGQIENSLIQKPQEKGKIIIEELESHTETGQDNESDESTFDSQNGGSSKRLAIEEITESPRQMLDEICNCHVTDDDTRPLSKSTKEMLSIFKTNDSSMARSKNEKVSVEENETQLTQTSSKSINMDEFNSSKRSSEKANTKKGFKNIKIQNAFKGKSNIYQTESFIEEKKNSTTKIEEMFPELRKNFNTDHANKKMEENIENRVLHSTKEIVSDVEENKQDDKTMLTKQVILQKASPFEFLQVWLSNSCNSNSTNGAACLLAVKPQELPKILTNKLDGPLLSSLFMAIKYLFNTGKLKESSEYLKFLLEVPRIKLTALFLSSDEKNDIQDLLISMENQLRENLNYARKVLSISREQ